MQKVEFNCNEAVEDSRPGFFCFQNDIVNDMRMLPQCNQTLYVEATLPRISDQNLELWVLRIYYPSSHQYVSVGILLIPREHILNVRDEVYFQNTYIYQEGSQLCRQNSKGSKGGEAFSCCKTMLGKLSVKNT